MHKSLSSSYVGPTYRAILTYVKYDALHAQKLLFEYSQFIKSTKQYSSGLVIFKLDVWTSAFRSHIPLSYQILFFYLFVWSWFQIQTQTRSGRHQIGNFTPSGKMCAIHININRLRQIFKIDF